MYQMSNKLGRFSVIKHLLTLRRRNT